MARKPILHKVPSRRNPPRRLERLVGDEDTTLTVQDLERRPPRRRATGWDTYELYPYAGTQQQMEQYPSLPMKYSLSEELQDAYRELEFAATDAAKMKRDVGTYEMSQSGELAEGLSSGSMSQKHVPTDSEMRDKITLLRNLIDQVERLGHWKGAPYPHGDIDEFITADGGDFRAQEMNYARQLHAQKQAEALPSLDFERLPMERMMDHAAPPAADFEVLPGYQGRSIGVTSAPGVVMETLRAAPTYLDRHTASLPKGTLPSRQMNSDDDLDRYNAGREAKIVRPSIGGMQVYPVK